VACGFSSGLASWDTSARHGADQGCLRCGLDCSSAGLFVCLRLQQKDFSLDRHDSATSDEQQTPSNTTTFSCIARTLSRACCSLFFYLAVRISPTNDLAGLPSS